MAVPLSNTKLRVPTGFRSILESFAREVLRDQPKEIYQFGAKYFSDLVEIRNETNFDPTELEAKYDDEYYNIKSFEVPKGSVRTDETPQESNEIIYPSQDSSHFEATEDLTQNVVQPENLGTLEETEINLNNEENVVQPENLGTVEETENQIDLNDEEKNIEETTVPEEENPAEENDLEETKTEEESQQIEVTDAVPETIQPEAEEGGNDEGFEDLSPINVDEAEQGHDYSSNIEVTDEVVEEEQIEVTEDTDAGGPNNKEETLNEEEILNNSQIETTEEVSLPANAEETVENDSQNNLDVETEQPEEAQGENMEETKE